MVATLYYCLLRKQDIAKLQISNATPIAKINNCLMPAMVLLKELSPLTELILLLVLRMNIVQCAILNLYN